MAVAIACVTRLEPNAAVVGVGRQRGRLDDDGEEIRNHNRFSPRCQKAKPLNAVQSRRLSGCQVQKSDSRRTGSVTIATRSLQVNETDAQSTSWRSDLFSPWRRDHTRGSRQDTRSNRPLCGGGCGWHIKPTARRSTESRMTSPWTQHRCSRPTWYGCHSSRHGRGTM